MTQGNPDRCWYCGLQMKVSTLPHLSRLARTRDHQEPVSRGGSKGAKNRVWACAACNQRKAAFTLDDFRARMVFGYPEWDGRFFGEREDGEVLPFAPKQEHWVAIRRERFRREPRPLVTNRQKADWAFHWYLTFTERADRAAYRRESIAVESMRAKAAKALEGFRKWFPLARAAGEYDDCSTSAW
jgi:hypothetical protein